MAELSVQSYVALVDSGDSDAEDPQSLECVDLRYSLGRAEILQGTCVKWQAGAAHALFGPSGAGKTTLMRCLIGDVGGTETGTVEVGGAALDRKARRAMSALVPQDDIMPFSLSARQILRFAARLRGFPDERADELLALLKLEACADRKVGDASIGERGASGGERKRISIGMELLSAPRLLCADEPSTGLDSSTALDVCALLRAQVQTQGTDFVLLTLHQPSWTLVGLFDSVTFLAVGGRVAYSGPPKPLVSWFGGLGHSFPQNENAADIAMRALQHAPSADAACRAWAAKNAPARDASPRLNFVGAPAKRRPDSRRPSRGAQVRIIAHRSAMELFGSRRQLMSVFGSKVIVGVLVGGIWYGQCAHSTNRAIPATSSCLFICVFNNTMETLFATLLHVPAVKALLHRESQNSLYDFECWFAATMIALLFQQCVAALLLATPIYVLSGLRPGIHTFALFGAAQALLSCVGAALGLAVGGLSVDYASARQKIMPTLTPLIIFAGYLLPYSDLHAWCRWIYWCSLFQYGLTITKILQWRGVDFSDCTQSEHDFGACFLTGDEYLRATHAEPGSLARAYYYLMALIAGCSVITYVVLRSVALKPAN
ncbi:P-loop containing nucleoside triphosphate hydrolase protein [Pelagophyceae sp. CCMP2097]|nr:P-loop containing nucleoside triphosphate hydrolase protein [Pelagophyceae sp. CCMP2097]